MTEMNETLEELVKQRRGYKFLDQDGRSPWQGFIYDLTNRKQMVTDLNEDVTNTCSCGWNLATIGWIKNHCLRIDGVIVECTIPKKARIIVPEESTGKFRTDIIKIKKVTPVTDFFPMLKDINKRLSNYNPENPIIAETMPPEEEVKGTMAQVGARVGARVGAQVWDQVWDQVGDQVRAQVGDQVGDQVGEQVGEQVWAQVRDQVWAQVRDQVWAQVWDQVWAQVRDQVRDQVWAQVRVCAYKAVADFLNLDYDHPAFALVRLGIMVVNVLGKFKVFGKGGKFLGEF